LDHRRANKYDIIMPARLELASRLLPIIVERTNPPDLVEAMKTAIERANKMILLYNQLVDAEIFEEEKKNDPR
jgi:hypothetical protein